MRHLIAGRRRSAPRGFGGGRLGLWVLGGLLAACAQDRDVVPRLDAAGDGREAGLPAPDGAGGVAGTEAGGADIAQPDGGGEIAADVAPEQADVEAAAPEAGDLGPPARRRSPAGAFTGKVRAASFAGVGTSWSRAIAVAAGVVVTVNPDSDSLTVLGGVPLAPRAEIPVGRDPRTVALTDDGRYAIAVNRGDATVSLVDLEAGAELFFFDVKPLPYGAVIAAGRIFVTEWATGQLAAFEASTGQLLARAAVAAFPAGIAHCGPPSCVLAGGRGLLITHFYSGQLSLVDPLSLATSKLVTTGADTNFSQQVAIAPDGKRAYLPQTRSFADNPVRQFDTTVFPVVNVVDLATLTLLNSARITLDTADQPVGLPFAVDFLVGGQRLVVANAASDDLSIIDLATGLKAGHVEVGANPQGVAVAADGKALYVNQILEGSLRVLDAASFASATTLPLTNLPLAPQLLRGKKLFWSSNRPDLARDQWMACATCHFDGFHDARTWRSFPDGIRNTTALFNLVETAPLHWSGDLDELHDSEATVRFIQAGKGLAPAAQIDTLGAPLTGVSEDLDALAAFLRTLRPPASPYSDDVAGTARGRMVFDRLSCASCHAGAFFTDRTNHDVGTGDPRFERNSHQRGLTFDTPSLLGLWLTAPYLHDGSAATLDAVFDRGPAHDLAGRASTNERADLVTYLRSL